MIIEAIVTTINEDGSVHIAPMGVTKVATTATQVELAPFRPSRTLDNLQRRGRAVINYCDDLRIFAGCVTNRRDWETVAIETEARLGAARAIELVTVDQEIADQQRPKFQCTITASHAYAPFVGLNRAQAAILEAAILITRFALVPASKLQADFARLEVIVGKTAGETEFEAWGWIKSAYETELTRELQMEQQP